MDERGFILLHRKFYYGKYWKERRKFSKAEAFLSLLEKAQHTEHEMETYATGTITLRRGEMLTSLQSLSKEWQWSMGKVLRFIKKDPDIETITERHYTRIYLINYDSYQSPYKETEQERKPNGNQTETKRKRTKNEKNEKNENIYKVFEFWNSMQMHHHLKITDEIESHVGARIDDFGVETVCEAIKNYERILHSDNFWLTYKWTLVDFTKSMNRFETFLTYNRPFHKYLNTKKMSEAQLEASLQDITGRSRSQYDNEDPTAVSALVKKSLGVK